jgi:hypothetical protein
MTEVVPARFVDAVGNDTVDWVGTVTSAVPNSIGRNMK